MGVVGATVARQPERRPGADDRERQDQGGEEAQPAPSPGREAPVFPWESRSSGGTAEPGGGVGSEITARSYLERTHDRDRHADAGARENPVHVAVGERDTAVGPVPALPAVAMDLDQTSDAGTQRDLPGLLPPGVARTIRGVRIVEQQGLVELRPARPRVSVTR